MARQHMRFSVRGVGGGRSGVRTPSVRPMGPRVVAMGNGRVRATNGKRKA